MEKYSNKTLEAISKIPGMSYGDLKGELTSSFVRKDDDPEDMPIIVIRTGYTPPTTGYFVERVNRPTYTLEYVVSGIGYLNNEGREYTLSAGDVYLLKPFTRHFYRSDDKTPYSKIWINFRSDNAAQILKILKIENQTVFHCPEAAELFNKFSELEKISVFRSDVTYKATELVYSIFARLAQSQKNRVDEIPADVLKTKVFLDCSMAQGVSIKDVCEQTFFSRTHVISRFKKYYGVTPHRYVLDLKMSAACSLLKDTDEKICAIAQRLNFYNDHHFSQAFKKKFGLSPSEYRKSFRR